MKLDSVKVFLVSNPPPSFGGRYFVFLKLKTACGIEGVGEVYAATFGPKVVGKMIEDLFARRFAGRDPFQIESLWRESYGSGFSLRPELSLMGVISGLEMACWDIIGKAVGQPIYNLMGGKVHERLRSYTYLSTLPPAKAMSSITMRTALRRARPSTSLGVSPVSSSIPPAVSQRTIPGSPRSARTYRALAPGARSSRTARRSALGLTASSPLPAPF